MATERAADEAQIRQIIDDWVDAFRSKGVDAAMALHAPGVVSFDIVPPLRYVGIDEYRRPWEAVFGAFEGPVIMAIRDLRVVAGGDVAFSHSLNRMVATGKDGKVIDYWFRWTACYQKIDGAWRIVHDHSSAPTDFASGRASLDLEP